MVSIPRPFMAIEPGSQRTSAIRFKNRSVRVLVATDIAARGLDIRDLPFVVNRVAQCPRRLCAPYRTP